MIVIALSALMLTSTFTSGIQFGFANEYEEAVAEYVAEIFDDEEVVLEYEYIEVDVDAYEKEYIEDIEAEVISSLDDEEYFDETELFEENEIVATNNQVRLIDIFECENLAYAVARRLDVRTPDPDGGEYWIVVDRVELEDYIDLAALSNITELAAEVREVESLIGVEYLTNLTILHLSYNKIVDIAPLSELENLRILDLSHNQIADITPLSALTNLTSLRLSHNQITEITPLLGLTNLGTIDISHNQISDISQLRALRVTIGNRVGPVHWFMIYHNNPAVGGEAVVRRMLPRMVFHVETDVFHARWEVFPEPLWSIPAGTVLIPENGSCGVGGCQVYVRVGDESGWATNIGRNNEYNEIISGLGNIRSIDNIRRGPGADYSVAIFFSYTANQEVLIIGQVGDWYAIHDINNWPIMGDGGFDSTFWIHADDLNITEYANWNIGEANGNEVPGDDNNQDNGNEAPDGDDNQGTDDNNQNNAGNDESGNNNDDDRPLLPQTGINSLNVAAFGVITAKVGLVTAILKNKKKTI